MKVEVRGISQKNDKGRKYVDVLVTEEFPDIYIRHQVGVDIKVNRGKILSFLAAFYNVRTSDIVWPRHIRVKDSDIL